MSICHATALSARELITHLLETPNFSMVVQSLEPRILYQLIKKCGLEDSGEIIAVATTQQLMQIFDSDLWQADIPGIEERFDADRFGIWLEILAEMSATVAAEKIAEMDFDFVTAAFDQHVLVLDFESISRQQAILFSGSDEYEPLDRASLTEKALEESLSHEFCGYVVVSKRCEYWDTMLLVLMSLEESHQAFFQKLMARCAHISAEYIDGNGGLYEVLTEGEQVMSDVASDREQRRDNDGYVAPAQAAAFLKIAREINVNQNRTLPGQDPITKSYFHSIKHQAEALNRELSSHGLEHRTKEIEHEIAQLITILRENGIISQTQLALPTDATPGKHKDRLSHIREQLLFVQKQDKQLYSERLNELGYLANILMAGCSFQSRRLRTIEATDAVLAACNLGLEMWPQDGWGKRGRIASQPNPNPIPHGFLMTQDLIAVFKVGWSSIHEKVSLYVARHLAEILEKITIDDNWISDELARLCKKLRNQLKAGTPWRERDNLDVIAILDQPSWAALLGLIDECPVVPMPAMEDANRRPPLRNSSGYEFISESGQILWIRNFMKRLPDRLVQ